LENTVHDVAMFRAQYKLIRAEYSQDYRCANLSHEQPQCLPTLNGITHISDHQKNCGNLLRIPDVSNVMENKGV